MDRVIERAKTVVEREVKNNEVQENLKRREEAREIYGKISGRLELIYIKAFYYNSLHENNFDCLLIYS